jgi:hypothetical protein
MKLTIMISAETSKLKSITMVSLTVQLMLHFSKTPKTEQLTIKHHTSPMLIQKTLNNLS